jgi:hypothetical protein
MVNTPATAKPTIESEDAQIHSQFVNVMRILLQTINDIIEATPNDMESQNDADDQFQSRAFLDDKMFEESENSGS